MISGEYYITIYLFIVVLVTFIYAFRYRNQEFLGGMPLALFFMSVIMILFIGLRPLYWGFIDMMNYSRGYDANWGLPFKYDWSSENFIFDNWFLFCSSMLLDKSFFFLSIALIYFGGAAIACKKLFDRHSFMAYLFFLGAFSTFSYGTNGIKAGAAMSVFLMALAWWNNKKISIFLLWLSLGLHHSMLMPIAAFILCYFVRKPKLYFWGWIFCLILSAAHFTSFMDIISDFIAGSDAKASSYLVTDVDWGGKTGFRFDFVLYSFMPILSGYYIIFKRKIVNTTYSFIWSLYCVINAFWLICMYAQFTNRIAYLSWGLYPIVLCYPYLAIRFDKRQYKWLANIALLHVGFTLFMNTIYY